MASDIWEVLKYHEPVFISNTPKTCYFLFMLQGEEISHNMQYTYSFLVSSKRLAFQLHHAVHNMSKKPLGLFWQFGPSTSNYNDTLYYNLIQDLTIRQKTSDRAERQLTQLHTVRRRPEKTCRKKTRVEKSRQEIWVGTMAQTLNSPSYEATNFKRVYPRWLKKRYT